MSAISFNPVNTLNRAHSTSASSLQKIATGSQHPSAANGASEYAISKRMYSNIGAIAQSNANTQNSNAMLSTAQGAISNTVSSLTSLREQLISAANGTNNASDLANLQKSVDQTISQINENAGVTFNGQKLLDGEHSTTVAGVNGDETVNFGNMTSQGLGLTDEHGNSTINLTDFTDSTETTLASGESVNAAINSALEKVDSALNAALDQATSIGAAQQGLDYQSANYTTMQENVTDAVSTLDDTDLASEITKLKGSQTQEQLATWGVKMFMQNRASALSLLQQ